MRLTVLGGSGVRSAFLVKSPAYNAHRIGLAGVVFLDNSVDNLAISGEITHYIFSTIRPNIQLSTTTDPVVALQDTNYIITTLRAGGNESRIHDERTALQHSTLGQETTGAGGFAMAMRSILVILRYCRLIEEHTAEDAILLNFTSPSGLVMEAIVKSGFERRVCGIYDAPPELIRELPAILGCEGRDLNVECYGLNYFSWFTRFIVCGGEVTERLVASLKLYQKTVMQYFSLELVRPCDNQLLNEYLYYYYYREVALKAIQEAGETHGEWIACINQEMREALRAVDARTQPEAAFIIWMQHYLCQESNYMQNELQQEKFHTHEPPMLRRFIEKLDTSGYVGVALDILEAVNSTTAKRIVVSIQNHDTLNFSHSDDAIEISCSLSRDGLKSVTSVKVSTVQKNMISCVKEYERLAVAAILQQNKSLTIQTLMAYPLIGPYSLAKTLAKVYLDDEQFAVWQ